MLNENKKQRIIEIDYIKTLMIFLVVFGHFLECFRTDLSVQIYQFIYIFHIPLFVFISGYLSKFRAKDLLKTTIIYVFFQLLYFLFVKIVLNQTIQITIFSVPYWILWYLISFIFWKLTIPFLKQINKSIIIKTIFILFIIALSLASGYLAEINRNFSLARTINFYPFFVIGYYFANRKNKESKLNIFNIILFIFAVAVSIILINSNYFSNDALYRAVGYSSAINGLIQRVFLIILPLMSFSLIFAIKIKKSYKIIEIISKNTLTIYLLHGFIILLFKHFEIFKNNNINILISLVISFVVVIVFGIIGELNKQLKNKILKK